MKQEKLILIGAGGHCKSCIEVIEAEGRYAIAGLLDKESHTGETVSGYPVIGTDDDIPQLAAEGHNFLITIGQLKSSVARKNIYKRLMACNASLATVIAPGAKVSQRSIIGRGSIVMHGVFVNAGATIGVNSIINTASLIEHDAVIGDHCHISTAAVVNGNCVIGSEVFLGSGAVLVNGISICDSTVVGAGTIIFKSISEAGIYIGQPFRKIA